VFIIYFTHHLRFYSILRKRTVGIWCFASAALIVPHLYAMAEVVLHL
jgi:hypothetical protein